MNQFDTLSDVIRNHGLRGLFRSCGIVVGKQISRFLRVLLPPERYWDLAVAYHNWKTHDVDAYEAPLNPFELRWVDPDRIQYHSNRPYPPWMNEGLSGFELIGRVVGGDWDRQENGKFAGVRFEERGDYRAMLDRFENGTPWKDVDAVPAEEKTRDPYYDELYEAIQEDGYRTQRELLLEGDSDRIFREALFHEVAIDIGRDGEPLFVNGSHRLTMAKLLGIEEIPVVVFYRHEQWMKRRDEAYRNGGANHFDFDGWREDW